MGFIEDCLTAVDACSEAGSTVFLGIRHIRPDGTMQYGERLEDLAEALEGRPVGAILLMCSSPKAISAGLPRLRTAFSGPVGAYPNLGYNPTGPIVNPDYSWDMLIRASNPAFSGGRSPVSLEPLSIRLNRLKNRTIEPLINRLPARGTVIRRQVDFPVRNSHRFGPFHGPDASSVHYPGAQDTRARLFHNRFQSVAP